MQLTSDKINVQILDESLVAHGVRHAVISPGSRNTPVIMALARNNAIVTHTVIDERSAAFIALGMAAQSGEPVALVCTSGSAILNYAPAIAEAYYREIPLIVISADRPSQWIDQDDSQTIRQPYILRNIVKHSCDIDVDSDDPSRQRMALRDINDTIIEACSGRKGPVHINIHLDVPLSGSSQKYVLPKPITTISPNPSFSSEQLKELSLRLYGRRVLVVAGFMPPDHKVSRALARLAAHPAFAIMHEAQANIHAKGMIASIDSTLAALNDEEYSAMRPDIVITFGGSLVSRFIKKWLRSAPEIEHWHIGLREMSVDPFNALTLRIEASPATILPKLAAACLHPAWSSDYASRWTEIDRRARAFSQHFIHEAPWSDFSAMAALTSAIPSTVNLHLSNGTAVRYIQLFDYSGIHRIESNRGVSGIDGATSTALGASVLYPHPTLLITGDMSAQYDIAAFSSQLISPKFKIAVLNNGGGGIFRFIDSTRNLPELEDYLAGNTNLPLEGIVRAYGMKYLCAYNPESLRKCLPEFFAISDKPVILDIVTDGSISANVLSDYFSQLKKSSI